MAELYWLSTVRPDGRPHVTPLIAVWLEEALYFCTGPDERKAKNLARNTHCVVTTGCNALNEGFDLVVEGDAVQYAMAPGSRVSPMKEGIYPGIQYPRVPGHEVAGVIDAIGPGVFVWQPGQRVGVGWNGGYCGQCDPCRRGEFFACVTGQVTGITYDGGYAEYMIATSAVALIPAELSAVEAAPLMCAGLTTFNALRSSGARPGDVVAVLGLGGLGHLAVQYSAKMGFHTIGIARGKDKEPLARQLGASVYIDSQAEDPAAELLKLGGASVILATATSGEAISAVQEGLAVNGTLLVVGAAASMQVAPLSLLAGRRSVKGWYSGTSIDSQDTLGFSARSGVRSMNESFPLERASEAYDRMMSGRARFRVVLVDRSN